jgi:hypothetical protein
MIGQGSAAERHERANFRNVDTIGFELMETIASTTMKNCQHDDSK